jgi:hypothetical protein
MILQVLPGGGATDTFISKFFSNDIFEAVTVQMTKQTQAIAIGLAVFLFLITLGYNYMKHSIDSATGDSSDGKIVDIKDIVRCIVIIFFISIYSLTVLPAINDTVRGFNQLTIPSTDQQTQLNTQVKQYLKNQQTKENDDKIQAAQATLNDPNASTQDKEKAQNIIDDQDPSVVSQIADAFDFEKAFERLGAWVMGEFLNLLSAIVKLVVGVLAVVLFKFLLVIGPLALAVSIAPIFRNQVDIWFGTTITTGLVITTMHILDCFMYGLINMISSADSFTTEDARISTVINITIVIMYLMSFWLTSKWIGKGDAGRFVSKAVTLATLATLAFVGAGAAAAGKGGGGAANVGNVVDTFKKSSSASNTAKNTGDIFKDD